MLRREGVRGFIVVWEGGLAQDFGVVCGWVDYGFGVLWV